MGVAAVMLATPALAKGPTEARITGPGLAHAIIVSGGGEPGQQGLLTSLAERTGFFKMLFGGLSGIPAPVRLRTPPPHASLGPRYTVIFTVPGVPPQGNERFGRIRQELYLHAVGGPVIYTPSG